MVIFYLSLKLLKAGSSNKWIFQCFFKILKACRSKIKLFRLFLRFFTGGREGRAALGGEGGAVAAWG